jgi:hypothetical protein
VGVNPKFIGYELTPVKAVVEGGRLRAFLRAIGDDNPAFGAADEGGTIPPTYLFCLEMLDSPHPFGFIEELGISIADILHADQGFTYHIPVRVGDTILFRARVKDIAVKKGGALTFVLQEVAVTNQDGDLVAQIDRSFAIRNNTVTANEQT